MVLPSPACDPDGRPSMPNRSLTDYAGAALEEHAGRALLLDRSAGAWRFFTGAEIDRRSTSLAASLSIYGLEPGSRVAVLSHEASDVLLSVLAVLRVGGIVVPLDPGATDAALREALRGNDVRQVLVSDEAQLSRVIALRPELPTLDLILMFRSRTGRRAAALSVEEACEAGAAALESEPELVRGDDGSPDAVAAIVHPSGTSGAQRRLLLPHRPLVAGAESLVSLLELGPGETVLATLRATDPACWLLGLACLRAGSALAHAAASTDLGTLLAEARPDVMVLDAGTIGALRMVVLTAARAHRWLGRMLFAFALRQGSKRCRAELAAGRLPVARPWGYRAAEILSLRRIRAIGGGRIRSVVSLGTPMAATDGEFFLAAGLPLLEGIATPETCGLLALNLPLALRPGTAGRLVPGIEARPEPDGRIAVRGSSVAGEGWCRLDLTARLDRDGFLNVGPPVRRP